MRGRTTYEDRLTGRRIPAASMEEGEDCPNSAAGRREFVALEPPAQGVPGPMRRLYRSAGRLPGSLPSRKARRACSESRVYAVFQPPEDGTTNAPPIFGTRPTGAAEAVASASLAYQAGGPKAPNSRRAAADSGSVRSFLCPSGETGRGTRTGAHGDREPSLHVEIRYRKPAASAVCDYLSWGLKAG